MYIITLIQAGHEFQYTQGHFETPLYETMQSFILAAVKYLQTCFFWDMACNLICCYPGSDPVVISVQLFYCYCHFVHLITLANVLHGVCIKLLSKLAWNEIMLICIGLLAYFTFSSSRGLNNCQCTS